MNDELVVPAKKVQDTPETLLLREKFHLERCRFRPWAHQVIGIKKLLENPYFALFDEMGAGKTLQVIAAAQLLFLARIIDHVIVVAPAATRLVWYDPELGELAKHLWEELPSQITLYHGKWRTWKWIPQFANRRLYWTITNYEYLRNKKHLEPLVPLMKRSTLLVLDESTAIKSSKSLQTKGVRTIRKKVGRVILLNGTPIANSPMDMFSQGNMMHPDILDCPTKEMFRGRYQMRTSKETRDGHIYKINLGWQNIEDLQQRFAPYVLRRLKENCVDLPPKLPPVVIPVTLSPATWKRYKEMKDEMVLWLKSPEAVSAAAQAVVKAMRLSQITSGFIGGLEESPLQDEIQEEMKDETRPDFIPFTERSRRPVDPVRELSSEKQDVFIEWLKIRLEEDSAFKALVRIRFRPELARAAAKLRDEFPNLDVGELRGGLEKREAVRLLHPMTADKTRPAVVLATSAGAFGYNFTGSHTIVKMSRDYSYFIEKQFDDRVHREGQIHAVSYFHMIAEGPNGQRTIDHIIDKAQRRKEEIATWTTNAWIQELEDESPKESQSS